MNSLKRFARLLSPWLVLTLVVAPVLPTFAMAIKAGASHAAHVSRDDAPAKLDPAAPKQTPCTQHDSCNGQCCAFCAQCFSTVSPVSLDQAHAHPARTPVLAALHPRLLITSPERPPRFLSY